MNDKDWLNLDDQVRLLQSRGLEVTDETYCRDVLTRVGYYHLSGYWRFFQVDPRNGDNAYKPGTTFAAVAGLQNLDSQLRQLCFDHLSAIELTLRTGFAYHFGKRVDPYGALFKRDTWRTTGARRQVHEQILVDLDHSKQPFIVRHRSPEQYASLPVWVAVEALGFGTLSKAIEHCAIPGVVTALADDLGVTHRGFSSQVRSFVALRNACAHLARLWNDVSKSPPHVPNNLIRRAKKNAGQFDPQSYYHVIVALDLFSRRNEPSSDLMSRVWSLLESDPVFRRGLMNPAPYK